MSRCWEIDACLDCCNALPVCSSRERPARLQINAAARVLTESRMKAHITHVLKSLHWPLVNFRIDFKFLLPVYRSLNGFAPKSISNKLVRIVSNGSLWSPNTGVPAVSSKTQCSPMPVKRNRTLDEFKQSINILRTFDLFSLFILWPIYLFVNFILCIYYIWFNCCAIYL